MQKYKFFLKYCTMLKKMIIFAVLIERINYGSFFIISYFAY